MFDELEEPSPRTESTPEVVTRVTLLMTDLANLENLRRTLGEERALEVFEQHDNLVRGLGGIYIGREINKSRGFLFLFERAVDAVCFAMSYHEEAQSLSKRLDAPLATRVGIHTGEIIVRENAADDVARGAREREVEGAARSATARMLTLALPRQTLLTPEAFESARRDSVLVRDLGPRVTWLVHGRYRFEGNEDFIEVCEAGEEGFAPLRAPKDTERGHRWVDSAEEEETLGWRPAAGHQLPGRPMWVLMKELGKGGFDEVWLAQHQKTMAERVYKFVYTPEKLAALRAQTPRLKVLKDLLANRDELLKVRGWQANQAPFFVEMEYLRGSSLAAWLETRGGLPLVPAEDRRRFAMQVASGLRALHAEGFGHGSLKPRTVWVREDERGVAHALLADFGLGTVLGEAERARRRKSVSDALDGFLADGSQTADEIVYRPPEPPPEDGIPTREADLYAFGVLAMQLLAGDATISPSTTRWTDRIEDRDDRDALEALTDRDPRKRAEGLDHFCAPAPVGPVTTAAPSRDEDEGTDTLRSAAIAAATVAVMFLGFVFLRQMGVFGGGGTEVDPTPPVDDDRPGQVEARPTPVEHTAPPRTTQEPPRPYVASEYHLDGVELDPMPPLRGEALKIRLLTEGTTLEGAQSVKLNFGKNNFQDILSPEPELREVEPGVFEVQVQVDNDAYQVDFTFHDEAGRWENNRRRGWHLRTYARIGDPPPSAPPFIMDGVRDAGPCVLNPSDTVPISVAWKNGWLYVSADVPLDWDSGEFTNSDAVLYISDSPFDAPAPDGSGWRWFLARQGGTRFVGWYPWSEQQGTLGAPDDPTRFLSARDGDGTFFEGTIRAGELTPQTPLYIALAVYSSDGTRALIRQAPASKDGDALLGAGEYFVLQNSSNPCAP